MYTYILFVNTNRYVREITPPKMPGMNQAGNHINTDHKLLKTTPVNDYMGWCVILFSGITIGMFLMLKQMFISQSWGETLKLKIQQQIKFSL